MTFKTGDFVRRVNGSRQEGLVISVSRRGSLNMEWVRVYRGEGLRPTVWFTENLELCPYGPTDQEVAAFTTYMLTGGADDAPFAP